MNPRDSRVGATLGPETAIDVSDQELREVKVRLPVDQVLRLHYARMKKRVNFSTIVSSALTRYLDDLSRT